MQKLYVAMVGLPASGKSTLARRIRDDLTGEGIRTAIFNNGEMRRRVAGPDSTNAEFYAPDNEEGRDLREQIALALLFERDCQATVESEAQAIMAKFIDSLCEIKRLLFTDVQAIFDNDPAVRNYSEVIFCYPVVQTMLHYRVAHQLHVMQVPILPRILTEQAHSSTGIDINPGAQIGEYFAIDHGTGVVIGETCIIGHHVTLYQGVTLGAKNFINDESGRPVNIPRHPIIGNHVTVYANSTILGRVTIGDNTVIGGNIWLTHSVPPNSRILQSKAVDASFNHGLGI